MISPDLLARLRSRAADSRLRTDASGLTGGTSFGSDSFQTAVVGLDGSHPEPPPPLPATASPVEITDAATRLGVALPDDMRQLYGDVADGGFGPSGGLASLDEIVERYLQLTVDSPSEGGHAWPEHLLPVNLSEPGIDCYDLRTGQIVFWDEESLADGPSRRIWERSFKKRAESLSAWLEDWVTQPPVDLPAEEVAAEAALTHLRTTLPVLRKMTTEERAAVGIAGQDWEGTLCAQLGVDPEDL